MLKGWNWLFVFYLCRVSGKVSVLWLKWVILGFLEKVFGIFFSNWKYRYFLGNCSCFVFFLIINDCCIVFFLVMIFNIFVVRVILWVGVKKILFGCFLWMFDVRLLACVVFSLKGDSNLKSIVGKVGVKVLSVFNWYKIWLLFWVLVVFLIWFSMCFIRKSDFWNCCMFFFSDCFNFGLSFWKVGRIWWWIKLWVYLVFVLLEFFLYVKFWVFW